MRTLNHVCELFLMSRELILGSMVRRSEILGGPTIVRQYKH